LARPLSSKGAMSLILLHPDAESAFTTGQIHIIDGGWIS
jgi:hypothetical protein